MKHIKKHKENLWKPSIYSFLLKNHRMHESFVQPGQIIIEMSWWKEWIVWSESKKEQKNPKTKTCLNLQLTSPAFPCK